MSHGPVVVVAVGGNALVKEHQRGTFEEQAANMAGCVDVLAGLVKDGYRLIITHGNGPQVGNQYLRGELCSKDVPAMPLDVYGAETQGQIGYVIEQGLANRLREIGLDDEVVTLITRVEVDPDDPNFQKPSKPVGPFYTREELDAKLREQPFDFIEDSGRGYRRVVASPRPQSIVQEKAIRDLVAGGKIVIAGGGGGIPVVRKADGGYHGVQAVIDKDRTSALIASRVGADFLLILTGVEQVAVNFGKPEQRFLSSIDVAEARRHLAEGQFPPGSMGPKVEAAMDFVLKSGKTAVITSLEASAAALAGETGTRICSTQGEEPQKEPLRMAAHCCCTAGNAV